MPLQIKKPGDVGASVPARENLQIQTITKTNPCQFKEIRSFSPKRLLATSVVCDSIILSERGTKMLKIKEFREERGITAREIVEVVREAYPGYDKYIHSKIENPEKYGCRLVNHAEQLLEATFTTTSPEPRKPDRRKRLPSMSFRVPRTKLERLQHKFRRDGFDTMQAGLDFLTDKYLKEE